MGRETGKRPLELLLCPPRPQRRPLHDTAPPARPHHIPHARPLGIVEVSRLGTAEVIIPLCPFFYHLLLDPLHLPRRRTCGECSSSTRVRTTQMTVGGRSPPEPRLFKSQTSGRQLDAHLGAPSLRRPPSPLFSTQVDFLVFNDRSSLSLNNMLTF